MRLDKFLMGCGVGSRNGVKLLLKKKLVTVNGELETSPNGRYMKRMMLSGFLIRFCNMRLCLLPA